MAKLPDGIIWNENMDNPEEDLSPRPYQSQVLDLAVKKNTIVFLPTGAGKTFIAVMLIKRLAHSTKKKFTEGGKRSFFLVNTVALAEQQKKYIQRHSCLSVGHYTGDMNVDFWDIKKWKNELDKHEILVMTAQILLDILNHSYIKLSQINLLIFDECHHAVNQHCMNKIMKHFEHYQEGNLPHVLGLTATLLNSSVKVHRVFEIVNDLEDTFRSKIATIENINEVESFSTSPDEKFVSFGEPVRSSILTQALMHIGELSDFVLQYSFGEDQSSAPEIPGAYLQKSKTLGKQLYNRIQDVKTHIETLGMYGGSISALKLTMHMERLRAKAEVHDTELVYGTIITTLTMIRTLFNHEMSGISEKTRILKFSSPQILTLLEVLKEYQLGDGRAIIFVKMRLTAQVLFNILRAARENIEELSFVHPDFIVGYNFNPLKCTREGPLMKKWNNLAIEKFHKGETNFMIASDVLEEGIDIPQCNLVVKFDAPASYRSYVQSKGRARHRNSFFVILIYKKDYLKLISEYNDYQLIEKCLKNILVGNREFSEVDMDYSSEGDEKDPEYVVGGARVSYSSAIPLVNRYCSTLPQDSFTKLVPYWYFKEGIPLFQCILQLPINSLLKDNFTGLPMQNKKRAKQSVAFEVCKTLHKVGELNDNLLPVGHHPESFINEKLIFSIYCKADEDETMDNPGTKKCRRLYKKKIPESFFGLPPCDEGKYYLHVLHLNPVYEEPSSKRRAFYDLVLNTDNCFAILSSKELPKLCDFPVFLSVGRIDVSVIVNSSILDLNASQIMMLKHFNKLIFCDLLKLHKSYLIADKARGACNYIVVPVKKYAEKSYEIDWQEVQKNYQNCKLHLTERLCNKEYDWMKFHLCIVVPWYRDFQVYVVTEVCQDKSPQSEFPTSSNIAYSTYEEYFQKRYSLTIQNSDQPLFEVRAISSDLNCLKPKGQGARRKRQEYGDDFETHLVPELCQVIDFPSTLWVKALCLPSCLHRIYHLLLAEELRQEIAYDLQFPVLTEEEWEALAIDPVCFEEDTERPKSSLSHGNLKSTVSTALNPKPNLWDDEEEPVDIDRERLEDVTMWDILHYDEFINKPCMLEDNSYKSLDDPSSTTELEAQVESTIDDFLVPKISFLEKSLLKNVIQPSTVLQALTCAGSNDALNLECLETLGDSFLKFSSSLFLFLHYPTIDEGKLTQAKGKIVGNRNLFYCGRNKNLIGRMKVHEFNPQGDWIPPGFCIPKEMEESLLEKKLCPSTLFDINLSKEEQDTGNLSSTSLDKWHELVNNSNRKYTPSPSESRLGVQSVPDKAVADCVEALIGAYLQGFGIEGAFKLIGWLDILPPCLAQPKILLKSSSYSPYVTGGENLEEKLDLLLGDVDVKQLEDILKYKFINKGILLQALSHPTYNRNRVTDCYQRLEFLGDAILDFLVTSHIYEHCGGLSPGDLTDLRSALVNNITFGSLAVRYGLHKFCCYDSSKLFDKIDLFVKFQEKNGHKVDENILLLFDENVCHPLIGESIDVPKVLGDLFESLAGAIFLDSGKCLSTVWNVYYRLMKKEIESFSHEIPKQPVRRLYELCNPPPLFGTGEKINDDKVMVELEVIFKEERKHYYGVGGNRAEAKRTAAKVALRDLEDFLQT